MVAGTREPVWAAACVVEDERHIAELADALSERTGPRADKQVAIDAICLKPLALALRHPGSGGLTGSVRATQHRVNPSAARDKERDKPATLWAPVMGAKKCP
jgi:hypothetical protein